MALTRVPFRDIKSNVTEISDNIITLNSGNVTVQDVGLVFDRSSNGAGSNVALVWQESNQSLIVAYTNSTGQGSGNIAVTSNANVAVGNIFIDGVFWSNGSIFASSATGPGNNNEFQYNNSGDFGSTTGITYVSSGSMQLTANLDAVTVRAATIGNVGASILGTNVTALSSFQGAIGTFGTNTGAFAGVTATTLSTSANATLAGLTVTGTATVNGSLKSNAGLQGTAVGNVTQASGKFTTIQGTDTTNSTSTTTGALIIAGGAGIAGNITAGNVSATAFVGDGSALTSIAGANVTGTVANATYADSTGSADSATTATTATTATYVTGLTSSNVTTALGYTPANIAGDIFTGNITGTEQTLSGNITANSYIISGSGVFWSNGDPYSSGGSAFTYTANTAPPVSGNLTGDQWYDTANDVLYEYQFDTVNYYWVDVTGAAVSTSIPTSGNLTIFGNIIPNANVAYDLGSTDYRFRSLYISGNTIDLGGATIKTDAGSGAIALIPPPTAENPNPVAAVISTSGTITTANTSGGTLDTGTIANAVGTSASSTFNGNVTANNFIISDTGIFYSNGTAYSSGGGSGGITTGKAIAMAIVFGG